MKTNYRLMISEAQTCFVYFSSLLRDEEKYAPVCSAITRIFDLHDLEYGFLPGTATIWCRDYMPVQSGPDCYIEFRYAPAYQDTEPWKHLRTDPGKVCDAIGIRTRKMPLKLEGGHLIRSAKRVIIADTVLRENPGYPESAIRQMTEELFEVEEVILLPWPREFVLFGHADGLLRFISSDHLLLNGFLRFYDPDMRNTIIHLLKDRGLKVSELFTEFCPENRALNWGYVNFLQTRDILLVPAFGIPEDERALRGFHDLFPEYASMNRIFPIPAREIIIDGGVLNCVSWNVLR